MNTVNIATKKDEAVKRGEFQQRKLDNQEKKFAARSGVQASNQANNHRVSDDARGKPYAPKK